MQTEDFKFEGRTYRVTTADSGEVIWVSRDVRVTNAMQPHIRRAVVKGDLRYSIVKAYEAEYAAHDYMTETRRAALDCFGRP